MTLEFLALEDFRLPGHPNKSISLDGSPLRIVGDKSYDQITDDCDISAPIGAATILYHWCPQALLALLDVDAWFSFTWILTLEDETKIEIGRIRNQVTMGRLDKEGLWKVMITYNMSRLSDGQHEGSSMPNTEEAMLTRLENAQYQGPWKPNTEETMLDEQNVEDPAEVDRLGRSFVKDLVSQRRWLTGRKMRHEFFIESLSLGMDPWEDGLAMNPHWLYSALDLAVCTTCNSSSEVGKSLSRCGRCGMAAYCSSVCQQKDWPVHKAFCALSAEDKGKALSYSRNGGLVNWEDGGGASDREEESELE